MCTISWRYVDGGYSVFFNRDESRLRPRAVPPTQLDFDNTRAIMPIDPQGEGSWLAVNDVGLSFALLNFYQGRLPKGRLISRGQVVKRCVEHDNMEAALAFIEDLKLTKYAPFSLLMFDPFRKNLTSSASAAEDRVVMLRWNGKLLERCEQQSPLISSAMNFEIVSESRRQIYRELLQRAEFENDNEAQVQHRALHASHRPSKSDLSICMHRDDASTVSFSEIRVNAEKIEFFYSDGAPCANKVELAATLPRR